MKIGLVRRGFSATGGAEAYLRRLARGLLAAGEEPMLITSADWPGEAWPGHSIVRLPGNSPYAFARAFQQMPPMVDVSFSLERVPGCDVFRAGDGVHAAWLRRRSQFEPFWKKWTLRYNPKHFALMNLEREVFKSARAVIANSQMVAEEIVHWHDYPRSKIHIVPNGIGQPVKLGDRVQARARLNLPLDAFVVLFVGSGWMRKGLATAIAAVEKLPGEVILLVAGRGRVSRYRSSRARFLGPVDDLAALFSAANVFTLPTIYDPFSNACLEALAAGLPVVTTTANGFSEIITPGLHGDVVAPGDDEALARALQRFRTSPVPSLDCLSLGQGYTIEKNIEATLPVLKSVCE